MSKRILLTRPRAASQRWATLLARYGYDCTIEPVLTIETTGYKKPNGNFQAVVITSAHVADALESIKESLSDLLNLPCFCVGPASGNAARDLGFIDIHCGASDSVDLASIIIKSLKDTLKPILHIAGDVTDTKLHDMLVKHKITLTTWIVYRARASEDLTAETCVGFINGDYDAVLVFSPRSAHILISLMEKNCLVESCAKTSAIGLSQAVGNVLQTLPWRRLRVAQTPEEESVLACLHAEFSMNEDSPKKTSLSIKEKRSNLGLFFLGAGVLAGIISLALAHCPWFYPNQLQPAGSAVAQKLDSLEHRVENIEARLNTLAEIPSVITQPVANVGTEGDTTSTEAMTSLQAQVAQLQSKSNSDQQTVRKITAASIAYLDLRDAANQGRAFKTQLENLRLVMNDDSNITDQVTKLEPYANISTPTTNKLLLLLKEQEASFPTFIKQDNDQSFLWNRLASLLKPLISVHPLHNTQLEPLEQALDQGDSQTAMDAYKVLPVEMKAALTNWHEQLQARMTIDSALRDLTTYFVAVPTPGSTK